MRIRGLTNSALMAAVLCVISPFSVPLGVIPITFVTLGVYLCAIVLSPSYAVISVGIYILLGIFGLPVFSGASGGLGVIAGPTGGYIIGYVLCVFIASFLKKRINIPLSLTLATVVLYIFGTEWFMAVTESIFSQAVVTCVLPFIPGDAVKIWVATVAARKLNRIL